jgi:DNA-binding transcriptional ArsR family regulator
MSNLDDKRYKALDHPIRREIVQLLAREPQTYSQLLQATGIESGHLAYHIRNLNELIEKDAEDRYYLNPEGVMAYDFLVGAKQGETPKDSVFRGSMFVIIIILMAVIAGVVTSLTNNPAKILIEELRSETYTLSLQSLDIIYEIFEDWEIPRDHWTDLLLKIVKIRQNLQHLYEYSEEQQYLQYAEKIEYYEDELSNVIVVGDPGYMSLTLEKRHLIRELHTLLMEIEADLKDV